MEYIILGHVNVDVDSIVSGYLLEKIMTKKGYKASFVIPDEEVAKESEDLCSKYDLSLYQFKNRQLKDDAKYILVDHNVRDVPGEIVAVIDHHPVLDGEKKDNYYIEEASSTACMISNLSSVLLGTVLNPSFSNIYEAKTAPFSAPATTFGERKNP